MLADVLSVGIAPQFALQWRIELPIDGVVVAVRRIDGARHRAILTGFSGVRAAPYQHTTQKGDVSIPHLRNRRFEAACARRVGGCCRSLGWDISSVTSIARTSGSLRSR